jgi:malate dehydrogenase
MAIFSSGAYGVADGVFSGYPCTCSGGEYSVVEGLDIDDFSRSRIDATIKELADEREAVRQLGLI